MNQVFLYKDDQQVGPFSPEQIRTLVANGHFSYDDPAWHEGMAEWESLRNVFERLDVPPPIPVAPTQTEVESPGDEALFHHVAPLKFILLTVVTFGLYELYWFWRGWKEVKQRENSDIWPFWRAFFAPVWFYPFAEQVFGMEGRSRAAWAGLLTVGYFLLTIAWRLPEPYWLISFASFIFVLPVVTAVHRLNKSLGVRGRAYRRFGVGHVLVLVVGAPLFAHLVLSSFSLIPAAQVVDGSKIPAYHKAFLVEEGILPEGEEILYFYSTAFVDYRADGNFFTSQRVVSYWEDVDGLWVEEALMSDITDIHVTHSTGFLEDTIIVVTRKDGGEVVLIVSAEEGGDHLFVRSLNEHWRRANPAAP
jgi:hypothetical protein